MRFVLTIALLLGASQAAAQPYAYVPNVNSGNVSVIDDATQAVIATIPVGGQPWGVAVSPDGSRAFVTNRGSASVSVIDTSTNTVIATVAVGAAPIGAVVTPDGSEAYIVNSGSASVSVIDVATNAVTATIGGFSSAWYLDAMPDGSQVLVADQGANLVRIIDTATHAIVGGYVQTNNPWHVTISPDGSKAYTSSFFGGQVGVIDLNTATTTSVPGTASNSDAAFSADGSVVYLSRWSGGGVLVVDVATDAVVTTIPTASGRTDGVSLTPDGSKLYVAGASANVIYIIDPATNTITGTVPVGSTPIASGDMFAPTGFVAPIAQGVELDAVPGAPLVYAEEINATPGAPVSLLNPAGDLNLSSQLGYSFSAGEVRYARFECSNGLRFSAGSTAVYDGPGNASLGAINGLGGSFMSFSVTANDNTVVASDRLVITGDRQITGTDDVSCTYGLYDFPSQAATGGAAGRVYTVTGPYLRFAPSYALDVEIEGNPIADVESADPAYSEFTLASPTNSVTLGRIGRFNYGEVQDVTGAVQPLSPAGPQVTLVDLMGADTALLFAGDFSAASDVFFSSAADCTVNVQSADDFNQFEAVFTIGSDAALAHQLCFATDGVAIPVSDYTVALDAVAASPAYVVTDLAPQALGEITRNGTELQAPLAQVPSGYLSRMVLTNTGSQARTYAIEVLGETGNVISSSNLTGTVAANATLVVDLNTVLTGFTAAPRATLNVTIAAPNNTIQGLYQIVNPNSGTLSNHVMVRPGKN